MPQRGFKRASSCELAAITVYPPKPLVWKYGDIIPIPSSLSCSAIGFAPRPRLSALRAILRPSSFSAVPAAPSAGVDEVGVAPVDLPQSTAKVVGRRGLQGERIVVRHQAIRPHCNPGLERLPSEQIEVDSWFPSSKKMASRQLPRCVRGNVALGFFGRVSAHFPTP